MSGPPYTDDPDHPDRPDDLPPEGHGDHPGRPQSPEVYRRRRLVAVVLLLVVLAVLIGLIAWIGSWAAGGQDGPDEGPAPTAAATAQSPSPSESATDPAEASDSPEASATESPSESASPSPSQSPSASASGTAESSEEASPSEDPQVQECRVQDLGVSAGTDQPAYTEGEQPVLELRVENLSEEPCEANVGTSQQVFTVTSGSDRVFSTADCQVEGEDARIVLEPGVQETARFTWGRERSAPGCEEVGAIPDAGTYHLEVSLGEVTGQPVSFSLQ